MWNKRWILGVLISALLLGITTPGVRASTNYDLKEVTPPIEKALEGRQGRYHDLQTLKAEGKIGENNRGYVVALKPSPSVDSLVSAENANRRVIYEAIVSQNQLDPQAMQDVESVFAEVQRERAHPGEFFQDASGQWSRKN